MLSVQNYKQIGIISTHPVSGIVIFEMGTHITKIRVPSKLIGRNGIIFVPLLATAIRRSVKKFLNFDPLRIAQKSSDA